MAEHFERNSRTYALVTVLSRVTGLARDATLSRVLGAGAVMDTFFFAFIIPNLFRRLFGEGALSAAFLRVYAQLDTSDRDTARRLATLTIGLLAAGLGALTIAGELLLYWLSARAGHEQLVVRLMMIMLPYMPMICLVAILGAMLQVHGRFGPSAGAPIVLNLFIIGATIGVAPMLGVRDAGVHVTVVAASVTVAGAAQLAWMTWALGARRWHMAGWRRAVEPLRTVVRQAVPMILGLGVLQLNVLLDGVLASYPTLVGPTIFGVEYPLHEGAMAAVSFAARLYQFPLAVVGLAVATAIFPALARLADDERSFSEVLQRGLRLVIFIGLPASAGLMLVGPLLVRVILEGGRFGAADVDRVAFVLYGYAAGVWAYSTIHVITRGFYAMGDTRTPVTVAVAMVALNLVLNCVLIWTPLREAGLAWSTAVCAVIQFAVLLGLARRRLPATSLGPVLSFGAKSLALTGVMAVAVAVVLRLMPVGTWLEALLALVVGTGTGVLVVGLGKRAMNH